MTTARLFPPPCSVEDRAAAFAVCDANGQALAYVHFEDEAFVLAPCIALAQSPSPNFQKIEHEYKPKKPDGTSATQEDISSGQASGKRQHKPITVIKETDKSSPNIMQRKAGGDPQTTGKPLTTTVNPALQGKTVLKPQKSDGSLDAAVRNGYDLKASKGR